MTARNILPILPIDKSLRRDLLAGEITIRQARDELLLSNLFNGSESDADTYHRLGLLPEIKPTF